MPYSIAGTTIHHSQKQKSSETVSVIMKARQVSIIVVRLVRLIRVVDDLFSEQRSLKYPRMLRRNELGGERLVNITEILKQNLRERNKELKVKSG